MITNQGLVVRLLTAAVFSLAIAVTGCSSDNGGDGGTGGGGTGGDGGMGGGGVGGVGGGTGGTGGSVPTEAVTADPRADAYSYVFTDSVEVTLTADDPASTIYYTTDLTDLLDEDGNVQGTEYTGPITIEDTTVLKFLASVDTGAGGAGVEYSAQQAEGYVDATGNPIRAQWGNSGHGDIAGEPWRHWDEDGDVSSRCAKCHGPQADDAPAPDVGLLEYLATGANTLASPLPLGLDCVNCHQTFPTIYSNLAKFGLPNGALEPVEFPSTEDASLYGPSNICVTCHLGRESGKSVQEEIDADDGEGPYGFTNIHYYAAAASFFGGETWGGYQYPGEEYRPRNTFPSHPDEVSTCVGCHMTNAEGGEMHTWVPAVDTCISCHGGTSFETLGGSPSTNLGNIEALLPELYAGIQTYAADVIGTPIEYDSDSYPYWFTDTGERYTEFDALLLPAAYNYQVGLKDPAGYIHNGTYLSQLFFDSIVSLGGTPTVDVPGRGEFSIEGAEIGTMLKSQQWQISGHGAAGTEPFRHWDADYEPDGYTPSGISASCTRCHSTPGFTEYAVGDPTTGTLPTTTVDCWACHSNFDLEDDPTTRYDAGDLALQDIVFPSGDTASFDNNSNMCMGCHQGRASGVTVDEATPNSTVQTPTDYDSYNFINIHYYAAGATLFGSVVNAGYEYEGNDYRGQNTFVGLHTQDGRTLVDCIGCHMNASDDADQKERHTFLPRVEDCNLCHSGSEFRDLSGSPGDNFREIEALTGDLYEAIQDYAVNGLPQASPVIYDPVAYPYWFKDNGQGANYGNRYTDFDFDMLTAAYNYQVALKDPAGYIHNGNYIEQLLWDSTCLMGGDPSTLVPSRPADCPPVVAP